MSSQTIVAHEFVRDGRALTGNIDVSALHRLRDKLYDQRGNVAYSITGSYVAGRPNLNLWVVGSLNLRCERCLDALTDEVAITSDLMPCDPLTESTDEDDAVDSIPADEIIDVEALVEDEILLSLPIAPRHEIGVCGATMGAGLEQLHAFAALRALTKESK